MMGSDFGMMHMGKPHEYQQRVLVVSRNRREFDDFMVALRYRERDHDVRRYKYVFRLSDIAGYKPDMVRCILLGRYYERPDWEELRVHLKVRDIECVERYDWL
jgi:hypothetical protein